MPRGSEPLYHKGKLIGRATNGGYRLPREQVAGARHGASGASAIGTELEIKILGKLFKATVIPESPYDPENKALRT